MGLDVYCGCKEHGFRAGSYSGFHEFRKWLASLAEIELEERGGFGGTVMWSTKEPFYELLNHSDCNGYLSSSECKSLKEDFQLFESKVRDDCFPPTAERVAKKLSNERTTKDYFWNLYQKWKDMIEHVAEDNCEVVFA